MTRTKTLTVNATWAISMKFAKLSSRLLFLSIVFTMLLFFYDSGDTGLLSTILILFNAIFNKNLFLLFNKTVNLFS
jgi:hypothetical protein